MHKNNMVLPTFAEVHAYGRKVYDTVVQVIKMHPALDQPTDINEDHPLWLLYMTFEHDHIHLETISVLFCKTDARLVQTPAHWPLLHLSVPEGALPVCPIFCEIIQINCLIQTIN